MNKYSDGRTPICENVHGYDWYCRRRVSHLAALMRPVCSVHISSLCYHSAHNRTAADDYVLSRVCLSVCHHFL